MNITIVVPFEHAAEQAALWAHEETQIDFRRDRERAARCTTAFAAVELAEYLPRTLKDVAVSFADQPPQEGFWIALRIREENHSGSGFAFTPEPHGLTITGDGRAGVLYGVYELLNRQGWRWYAPGAIGEIAPGPRAALVLPEMPERRQPDMDLGRGFYFEGASKESRSFWLWMARNKLNIATPQAQTAALCRKLGMVLEIGGHIFEAILHPDRRLPDGRTLWEAHPDWFGLPADGVRRKDSAQRTQFCASQESLVAFLGAALLERLMGPWCHADRVDIWGFDTWGSTCRCPDCQTLGNSTDQTLHFMAGLRDYLNAACADGRLDHTVQMVACGYEGTATMDGPTKPIPANLLAAGDLVTAYPINRCYRHRFADDACAINSRYAGQIRHWRAAEPALPLVMGEYYNVSKFEDLPLLFTRTLGRDFQWYHAVGARGMTYMHVPMTAWAVRTLTQALYAALAWDVHTDTAAFTQRYLNDWYGPHAEIMASVYDLVEESWRDAADWRAWSARSVLSQLRAWDGRRPAASLTMDNHFRTAAGAIAGGRRALGQLEQALALVENALAAERRRTAALAPSATDDGDAVNPAEVQRRETAAEQLEKRLGDDRRLLIYGRDVMALTVALVAYRETLYQGDDQTADVHWAEAETAADNLDRYWLPLSFDYPGPGFECRDALTRSQLRELLTRCRRYRLSTGRAIR